MSKKGGYLIIDLENNNIVTPKSSSNFKLTLTYNIGALLEQNYHKHALVSGIVVNGIEKDDFLTIVEKTSTAYYFKVYGFIIKIYISSGEVYAIFNERPVYYTTRFTSDKKAIINCNDFPYTSNLVLMTSFGTNYIQIPFNMLKGNSFNGKYLIGQATVNEVTHSYYVTPGNSSWTIEDDNATSSQIVEIYYVG